MAHVKRFAVFFCALLACGGAAVAAEMPLEYAVKASYLYKFAPFVQWPASTFEDPTAPVVICISGQNPFGTMLDDAVRGQRVNGHSIVVRRIEPARAAGCHILFVGAGEDGAEALRTVARQPVLTVTDRSRGVSGGIIQFVLVGGRVRFVIDQATAQGSGIAISSKLLGLAVSVAR